MLTLDLSAQSTTENFTKQFNTILSSANIPVIKDLQEYLKNYDDDFDYIQDLINTYKPFEAELDDCKGCYAFVISKPNLTGNRCIKGYCNEGEGILEISKNKIYYLGNFEKQLPHGQGVLYFVEKGLLKGDFYKGKLSSVEFIGTQGQAAGLKSSLGFLASATNWYSDKYKAYYIGSINNKLQMTANNYKNKLVNSSMELTLRQDESTNAIKSFFGKMKYNNGDIVEGNFNGNLKLNDGDVKVIRANGTEISSAVYDGQIDRSFVSIKEGNNIYKGEVDENFKPHGRGVMVLDGKRSEVEDWDHGKPKTRTTATSNANLTDSARSNFMASLKKQCSTSWSKYLYCRVPNGSITLSARGQTSIGLFNLSNKTQRIKIKLLFTPSDTDADTMYKKGWNTIVIPPTTDFTDFQNGVGKKIGNIHFPLDMQKHSIVVKGDGANDVFWVIQK
jgi:hypothetical protein